MANDLAALVNTALQRSGQRQTDTSILVPQIKLEVPNIQVSLEDEADSPRPWFLKTLADQGSWLLTTVNVNTIDLPSGFLGEVESADLYIVTTDSNGNQTKTPLTKQDYDDIQENLQSEITQNPEVLPITGQPKWYCLSATQILLFPTPDQAYQLEWSYYTRDSILTETVPATLTNNWTANAWNLLIAKLTVLVAGFYTQDDAALTRATKLYAEEHNKFRGVCIERDLVNHSMHMGQGK